jgi:transposase
VPHPGSSWQPQGHPAIQPHEYIRGGTCKVLTLFHPATGQVHIQPVSHCTNPVLHGWLKETLTAIVAALPAPTPLTDTAAIRAAWKVWQDGLAERFTLPETLPPLRLLLVWDNLAGHKTPEMVGWLCQHGIMPLYTPLGGSWLNMAESIQRILKRRALAGQHPRTPAEVGTWFEQTARTWNQKPTPFVWHGRRWQRRRHRHGDGHPVAGSAAHSPQSLAGRKPPHQEWHNSSQVTHQWSELEVRLHFLVTGGMVGRPR